MTDAEVIKFLREALMVTMVVSVPILGIGMIMGLIISIFQTTTQIQEQTLTFVPKIIAVFLVIILLSSWILHTLMNYTINVFTYISKTGVR